MASAVPDQLLCCMQLTLDNALAPYLTNQFGFSILKAGNLAAIFGIMNFGARPAGGILSDVLGKRFGIRGRIWALFLVFSLGGFFTAMTGVVAFKPFKFTLAMYILAGIFLEVSSLVQSDLIRCLGSSHLVLRYFLYISCCTITDIWRSLL